MKVRWRRILVLCLLAAWIGTAWRQAHRPLPAGLHVASPVCALAADEVTFIADISAADAFGRATVSQGIFDSVLELVRGARRFIVLDYAAFGGAAVAAEPQRRIAAELTQALLEQRRTRPDLNILFISDAASAGGESAPAPELQQLRAAGVELVATDLDSLRDSNLLYSSLWRLSGRTAPRRLNFKANARKLIIADDGRGGLAAVIGSASPLDSQSAWSNLAARVGGGALQSLLASELAVARFSGWQGSSEAYGAHADCAPAAAASAAQSTTTVQVLTEGAIGAQLIAQLDAATATDAIDVAMYRIADRAVIEALLAAARRGIGVRVILDPNEAQMSGGAAGIPNQVVASELMSRSGGAIHVRWYRTHGERFHDGLVMIYGPQRAWLLLGSAQLTRRSLGDYNLEADAAIEAARAAPLAQQALGYFETLWGNRAGLGIEYTADFAVFANPAQSDYWLYRLMEASGFAAF
jgi:phosphatidylserine/phosphatidylglycerophosphate/cardiolipin synthase-like enzyme